MNHKYRKNKRPRSGPMRDELWGLGPMADGGVGGVMCLITRARGAKRAVPPWTASSTAGFPNSSGKSAQPGAHAACNCFSALRHIRVCSMFIFLAIQIYCLKLMTPGAAVSSRIFYQFNLVKYSKYQKYFKETSYSRIHCSLLGKSHLKFLNSKF
jgi:hypothetical protein